MKHTNELGIHGFRHKLRTIKQFLTTPAGPQVLFLFFNEKELLCQSKGIYDAEDLRGLRGCNPCGEAPLRFGGTKVTTSSTLTYSNHTMCKSIA